MCISICKLGYTTLKGLKYLVCLGTFPSSPRYTPQSRDSYFHLTITLFMMVSLMLAEGVGALVIAYYIVKTFFATNTLPLPPGPKGLPILGNVSDLPRNDGKHE
jgi:hypothetical protein